MQPAVDFAWLSLVQRRADYARNAVKNARSPAIAKEFEELAAVYDGILGRAEAEARVAQGAKNSISRSDPRSDLIRYLNGRSHQFLMDARSAKDRKRSDDLKFLAGAFGAEAARLKNDGMR
jgi:hypothetical protein